MAIKDAPVELTAVHVKRIFGLSDQGAADWFPHIKKACDERQINTIFRLSAFLANVKVETGGLKVFTENLNYSSNRLLEIFPKYFKSKEMADQYANKPEKIANRVYGGRMGNGPEESGDGFRYRGRGCIQLTGKGNYEAATRGGVSCLGANSDYLTTKEGAIRSATWFWHSKSLNRAADAADFDAVVRRVNGGTIGMADRKTAYNHCLVVLSSLPDGTVINVEPAEPGTGDANQIEVEAKDPSSISSPQANHKTIQEPIVAGQAEYPYNQVFESRSGHLKEIDDTPGAERLHWYHRIGTYVEFQPDGTYSSKVMKDRYVFVNGDYFRDVKGDLTSKIGGQSFTKVESEYALESGGDATITAPTIQLDAPTVNAKEVLNVPFINVQMIKARPGSKSSGMVNDLKVRSANHADFADGAQWSMKAGKLGPGIAVPQTAAKLSGTWSSTLPSSEDYSGAVVFTPVSTSTGSSGVGFSDNWYDYTVDVVGNSNTVIQGNEIVHINGDRLVKSGGDLIDHNLGDREIASGQGMKIISDTSITIKAPALKFSPVKSLLFTPISGVAELDPPGPENNGLVAVFIDSTGALVRAKSNGSAWTVLPNTTA